MKSIHINFKRLSVIACIAVIFLLTAPSVSAADYFPDSAYSPIVYPVRSSVGFLGPPIQTDPAPSGYYLSDPIYGSAISSLYAGPAVIQVNPAVINAPPSPFITGSSGYVPGAFYMGSGAGTSGSSSSSGSSGWNYWFPAPSAGFSCSI